MSREPAYKTTIRSIYEERVSRNSQYSLRAYARDLRILPSRLNEILKGRCGLSPKAGKLLARRLGLNEIESRDFVDEVEALHARGKLQKKIARNRMASRESQRVLNLQVDQFRVISDWWHFAIIELMGTRDFKSDASWIAGRLGLTVSIISDALCRLEALSTV